MSLTDGSAGPRSGIGVDHRTGSALIAILQPLRVADWLSADRARAYCRILLTVTVIAMAGWVLCSSGGVDPAGKPLGTDFVSFWTASELALQHRPAAAYDIAAHHAAQTAVFGRAAFRYTAFFYPPVFLLICLPLAMVPYLVALVAWLGLTGLALWRCLRAILPQASLALAIPAYPAMILNIGHGQNGFLTAALFGGAMLALPARPILAGLCFGCLVYKPQLGIMIPLALLAGRRWTTLLATAAAALGLLAASAVLFGPATWRAFLAVSPLARTALERNLIGPEKMPSAFAAVRLLHGGPGLAYAAQSVVTVCVGMALVRGLRRRRGGLGDGALIAMAALLASPFLLDYDLTVMALPLAWVMRQALCEGFLPWEKITLAAGFVLPLLVRPVADHLAIPLGPPVLMAVFCMVLRRVRIDAGSGTALQA